MKNDHHIAIEINGLIKPNHYSKITELPEVESEEEFSAKNIQLFHTDQVDTELYVLVEKIKTAVHQLIYLSDKLPQQKTSNYISIKVNREYTYLNKIFMCITGISIKKYINNQKIELVKEILVYDETDLFEIARKLHFRSVSKLESKFIKETGISTAFYKLLRKTSAGKSQNV